MPLDPRSPDRTVPSRERRAPRARRLRTAVPLLLLALAALAEAAPFRLVSGTVDGGGAHSQGTRFTIEGTTGQPDAGLAQGARFRVDGGFWPTATAGAAPVDSLFRNSFED